MSGVMPMSPVATNSPRASVRSSASMSSRTPARSLSTRSGTSSAKQILRSASFKDVFNILDGDDEDDAGILDGDDGFIPEGKDSGKSVRGIDHPVPRNPSEEAASPKLLGGGNSESIGVSFLGDGRELVGASEDSVGLDILISQLTQTTREEA